ncbi:YbaB/EbfC family nucleoid-associated protein [Patescibacteria group bacterium]|nr:YbaB/EbfC family nucleoid-associated protein [Patescibacteria group bacterium]
MFNKLREYKDKVATAKKLMDLQKKVAEINVEGTSGWGKVKITINGLQQMLKCEIDQELMGDKTKLEALICEATNDAVKKLQQVMAERMKELGGDDLASELGDLMKQG